MNSMMMLSYMYALCNHRPLVFAIKSNITEDDKEIGWIGLFGGKRLSIEESNAFLEKYLDKEKL